MSHAGRCQCGAVAVTAARIGRSYACHCRECQRQSASAFAVSVPVWTAELAVAGALAWYRRFGASGAETACAFCAGCGTRLFHRSGGSPAVSTLKGGVLDAAAALTPVAHLWTRHKAGWIALPRDVPAFATQPADLHGWRAALLP